MEPASAASVAGLLQVAAAGEPDVVIEATDTGTRVAAVDPHDIMDDPRFTVLTDDAAQRLRAVITAAWTTNFGAAGSRPASSAAARTAGTVRSSSGP